MIVGQLGFPELYRAGRLINDGTTMPSQRLCAIIGQCHSESEARELDINIESEQKIPEDR